MIDCGILLGFLKMRKNKLDKNKSCSLLVCKQNIKGVVGIRSPIRQQR